MYQIKGITKKLSGKNSKILGITSLGVILTILFVLQCAPSQQLTYLSNFQQEITFLKQSPNVIFSNVRVLGSDFEVISLKVPEKTQKNLVQLSDSLLRDFKKNPDLVKKFDDNLAIPLLAAFRACRDRELNTALEILLIAEKIDCNSPAILRFGGYASLGLHRFKKAANYYERLLESPIAGTYAKAEAARFNSLVQSELGNTEYAEELVNYAVILTSKRSKKLSFELAAVHNSAGILLYRMKEFSDAREEFRKATAPFNVNPEMYRRELEITNSNLLLMDVEEGKDKKKIVFAIAEFYRILQGEGLSKSRRASLSDNLVRAFISIQKFEKDTLKRKEDFANALNFSDDARAQHTEIDDKFALVGDDIRRAHLYYVYSNEVDFDASDSGKAYLRPAFDLAKSLGFRRLVAEATEVGRMFNDEIKSKEIFRELNRPI